MKIKMKMLPTKKGVRLQRTGKKGGGGGGRVGREVRGENLWRFLSTKIVCFQRYYLGGILY